MEFFIQQNSTLPILKMDFVLDGRIYYKWTQKDTNKKGRYKGQFSIILEDGELIAPIREDLYINII